MKIRLTLPEFIVALFGLDPSKCLLTNIGLIANIYGFAYQLQSHLFEQVKIQRFSYRSNTAKLRNETYISWTGSVSATTAQFELDTLIDALKKIEIKQQNGLISSLGKDPAWSWRWPIAVYIFWISIFNALLAIAAPFGSKGITYVQLISHWPTWVGILALGILFLFFSAYPLRYFLFDSSFLRRRFKSTHDMMVLRAEIFKRIKALDDNAKNLGALPEVLKLIDEDNGVTFDHAVTRLMKKLQDTQLELHIATTNYNELYSNYSKTQDRITSLEVQNKIKDDETIELLGKLNAEQHSHAVTKAELSRLTTELQNLKHELKYNKQLYDTDLEHLSQELTKYTEDFSEKETVKFAKVLYGILEYIKDSAKISQAEIAEVFQTIHDRLTSKKGQEYFDTKLQTDTVNTLFARTKKLAERAGMKAEWFRGINIVSTSSNNLKK